MTTIAYKTGRVAVDSVASVNGWIAGYVEKWRLHNGVLYVISGSTASMMTIMNNAITDSDSTLKLPPDSRLLRFGKQYVSVFEDDGYFNLNYSQHEILAWGGGFPPALAAMKAGADPRRAIEIVSEIDATTGGKIYAFSLHSGEWKLSGLSLNSTSDQTHE